MENKIRYLPLILILSPHFCFWPQGEDLIEVLLSVFCTAGEEKEKFPLPPPQPTYLFTLFGGSPL